MNICCCINEKFIEPFKVLCYSLVESQEEKIDLYLVYDSISEKEMTNIKRYLDFLGITLYTVPFPKKIKEEFYSIGISKIEDPNLSFEIYFRLFLPSILLDINRILYLDSDIIVQKNISAFYHSDFRNMEAIAVLDITNNMDGQNHIAKHLRENLELDENSYINSGVLLLNLEKLRESGHLSMKNIFKTITERKIIYHDQDILNFLLKNTLFRLSNYNYNANVYMISPSEMLNAYILHYAADNKPWIFENNSRPAGYLFPYVKRAKMVNLIEDYLLGE